MHVSWTTIDHGFWHACSRQAAEYTYFALAIAVCLGIIFAVLTNCQFAASFFTLVLLILTVVYSIIAVIFFLIASIGNDGCALTPAPSLCPAMRQNQNLALIVLYCCVVPNRGN